MNFIDIAIILALGWFTVAALSAGLVREVITLTATVLAILVAGLYHDNVARDLLMFVESDNTANIIGFLIILGAILVAGQLVASFMKRGVSMLMLGWADHLAGAIFGLFKGFLVVQILLIVLVTFEPLAVDNDIAQSTLAPFFLDITPILLGILPDQFEAAVNAFNI